MDTPWSAAMQWRGAITVAVAWPSGHERRCSGVARWRVASQRACATLHVFAACERGHAVAWRRAVPCTYALTHSWRVHAWKVDLPCGRGATLAILE